MLREPQPCAAHLQAQWLKWRLEQDEACKSTVLTWPEPVKPELLQRAAASKKRRRVFGLPREREPGNSTPASATDKHKKHVAFQKEQKNEAATFHDINKNTTVSKPTRPQSAREPDRGTPLEARLQRYRANSDARLLLQQRLQEQTNEDAAAAEHQPEQAAILAANKIEVGCLTMPNLVNSGADRCIAVLDTAGCSDSYRQEDSDASCTCTAQSSGWCCHC